MKRNEIDHDTPPDPIRRPASVAMALGVVLAVCSSGLARPEVIDDFEQGYRFWVNGGGGGSQVEIIDGQLHLSAPPDGFVAAGHPLVYAIPETETLTLGLDVISRSSTTWAVQLACEFTSGPDVTPSGYVVSRLSGALRIGKWWDGGSSWLTQQAMPVFGNPETMTLSLTREGDRLRIVGEATDRATGDILASVTFLDRPGIDPTLQWPDNGPPTSG